MNTLLSGFAGALAATFLAIMYQSVNYAAKHRLEIMFKVVEHLDGLCYLLLNLREQSGHTAELERAANETKARKYQALLDKLKRLLESSIAATYIKSSYGNDSDELKKFNELHNEISRAEKGLITGIYTNDLDDFDKKFREEIHPHRKKLTEHLLEKTKGSIILSGFFLPWKKK